MIAAEKKNEVIIIPLLVCSAMSMTHLIAFIRVDLVMFLLLFPIGVLSYLCIFFIKQIGVARYLVPAGNLLVCLVWMTIANKATYDQYLIVVYNHLCICVVLFFHSNGDRLKPNNNPVNREPLVDIRASLRRSEASQVQAENPVPEQPRHSGMHRPADQKEANHLMNDSTFSPLTIDLQAYNHSIFDPKKTEEAKKYMESSAHNSIDSLKAEGVEPRELISDPSFMSRNSSDASLKN